MGKRKKEERRKRKIRLKAPALKFRAGFLIFSDLPRFPLGFRCLAENCMQFFLFFLQKMLAKWKQKIKQLDSIKIICCSSSYFSRFFLI